MRIKTYYNLIGLSIVSLMLLGALASADVKETIGNAKDAIKDTYDAVLDKAAELNEKLKHAGEDIKIGSGGPRQGESKEDYRARSQENVYRRSNDAYNVNAVGGKELRDALNNLYQDASSTWNGWEKTLGNKWKAFKDSLVDKVDGASDKIHDSFYDTIHDFQHYVKDLENKGADYTDEAKNKASKLVDELRSSYENYKSATKARYDEWSQDAKDKVEEGADKAKSKTHQAYEDAKAKYHQSKNDFNSGMKNIWGSVSSKANKAEKEYKHAKSEAGDKVDTASGYIADSYDSLKHGINNLYNDASSTWNSYKEKLGAKWHDATGDSKNQSPANDFQNSINDFLHYEKVFEETGDKYPENVRDRIGRLLDDLKEKYDTLKERVASWSGETSDQGQSPAYKEYEDALFRFNQSKARFANEMSYASGTLNKQGYYGALKNQLGGLYSDAESTISSWKEKLGDKWNQVTASDQKDAANDHTEDFQDTIKDFIKYQQVFEDTKAENTYTEEARIKVSDLLDDLQDKYQAFKDAATKKWGGLITGDNKHQADTTKDKTLQAYNQAKVGYYRSKGRLQDEIDYISGKISKDAYDAKMKVYDVAGLAKASNAIKRGWRAIKSKLGVGSNEHAHIVRDYVKETVTEYVGDDQEKIMNEYRKKVDEYEKLKDKVKDDIHKHKHHDEM